MFETHAACQQLHSIAAGMIVLFAGGDYKSTPTQCLLNCGPESPVLASIHQP